MKTRTLVSILIFVFTVMLISSCATRLNTALQFGGDYDRIKRLIEKGADVNAQNNNGWTALMLASAWGYIDIVTLLIEEGAYVNARTKHGNTALMYASQEGHPEVAELLIEKGADINVQEDYGWTALMFASDRGQIEVTKLLIEKGADVNTMSIEHEECRDYGKEYVIVRVPCGYTALMAASEMGHIDIVKLLIEAGADVNATLDDYDRSTALKYASKKGHTEIVELLIEAGAKE